MTQIIKNIVYELGILPLFIALAYLDYIVHDVLYSYGLQFSYEWAVPYWTIYSLIFVIGCWLAKSYLGILLFAGALQDIIMFMGFSQDFSYRQWIWTPHHTLFGYWNVYTQIAMLIWVVVIGLSLKWEIEKRYFYRNLSNKRVRRE